MHLQAGAWPAETIGIEYPVGSDIPIDHVIVIVQENRSFDHYLGRLVAQGYYQPSELDGPPPGWSNPDGQGGTVTPHPDDDVLLHGATTAGTTCTTIGTTGSTITS